MTGAHCWVAADADGLIRHADDPRHLLPIAVGPIRPSPRPYGYRHDETPPTLRDRPPMRPSRPCPDPDPDPSPGPR